MRKKLLAILLALTAGSLTFGLTACGDSDNGDGDNTGANTEQNGDNGGGTESEAPDGGEENNTGDEQPDVAYSEGLEFRLSEDETCYAVAGKGTCQDTEIYIPKTYNNKPVTSIGENAFREYDSLENIVIPDSVTSICDYAFAYCSSLESIVIPDSVEYIGEWISDACSSLKYNEYDNALYLGNATNPYVVLIRRKDDSVTSCDINANTKVIADHALRFCRSQSITIPDSVKRIGNYAFAECYSLESVTIGNGVTSIGSSAFTECLSLESISIPDSVTDIGMDAFLDCISLKYNEYDNALYLGNATNPYVALIKVKDNSIASCNINENTKVIAYYAFYGFGRLESITIPDSVKSIGYQAFFSCVSLKSITIPDSVTSIGNFVFAFCDSLESITVEEGNTKYHSAGNCIVETASKTLVVGCNNSIIPTDGSVARIGGSAFGGYTSLEGITIPDRIKSIGASAFAYCYSFTSITIPDGVTSIGGYAFYRCGSLSSINFNGTRAQWDTIEKGNGWNNDTGDYVIHCTDGDIEKE